MTEHGAGTGQQPRERLAAHERLATGAFARWTRACATHPWRVVGAWLDTEWPALERALGIVAPVSG